MISFDAARQRLRVHRQEQLLDFHDQLSSDQQQELLGQIERLDLDALDELIRTHVLAAPEVKLPADLQPAPMLPPSAVVGPMPENYRDARARGQADIAAGKVAALVVAGGAGTRLGFDGPKGCLAATPVKRKPLFQVLGEQVLAARRRWNARIPWYVMTSPGNDRATREFFAAQGFFGLPGEDVFFFVQGQMPAIGLDGKILLEDRGRIALSPDGHGGTLRALRRSGALADMARRGIEYISYFQVDNPLVHAVDPLFIGLHAMLGADMSAKAIPKRHPLEKLGNFGVSGGKVMVIEYSDLPDELAQATRPDGKLLFSAGSIAIHVITRSFVEELTGGGELRLPFHRALKKAPFVDKQGRKISPDRPNAVKLEMFVFDALPLARNVVILETRRSEEFSPIKNAKGEDSLEASLHDQVRRAGQWLESAGVLVPRDAQNQYAATIEISPLRALDAEQFAQNMDRDMSIRPGQQVYLE